MSFSAGARRPDIQYRNLGESDLVTPAIGFGSWPMGRGYYGAFDDK